MNQQEPQHPINPTWFAPETEQDRREIEAEKQAILTEHEFIPAPTAWQSLPGAVRLAVWLWAVSMIMGAVGGILFALVWALSTGPNT
jgi:hypothetical protein